MKNRALRLSAILLGVVLITSCVFSETLAKYISDAQTNDIARAAKWGVTIALKGDLFDTQYENEDGIIMVKSSTTERKVAPGTSKTMMSSTVNGKPEVDVEISCKGELELRGDWVDADGNFYCPLEFTLSYSDGTGKTVKGKEYSSQEELKGAVRTLFENADGVYASGTDLSTANFFESIGWKWEFEGGSQKNDARDTFLGILAAENGGINPADGEPYERPNLCLTYEITVTQVD